MIGLWHAMWAGLVALGVAQALMDFILHLHFVSLPLRIEPFDFPRAAMLVGVTSLIGFAFGVIAAWVWNALHPQMKAK
jgi:hypothetical protein